MITNYIIPQSLFKLFSYHFLEFVFEILPRFAQCLLIFPQSLIYLCKVDISFLRGIICGQIWTQIRLHLLYLVSYECLPLLKIFLHICMLIQLIHLYLSESLAPIVELLVQIILQCLRKLILLVTLMLSFEQNVNAFASFLLVIRLLKMFPQTLILEEDVDILIDPVFKLRHAGDFLS